jgi:hypothetical protein
MFTLGRESGVVISFVIRATETIMDEQLVEGHYTVARDDLRSYAYGTNALDVYHHATTSFLYLKYFKHLLYLK